MSAVISRCGRYRYELRRPVGALKFVTCRLMWVMLNPSTADATEDDATIRRCRGFSEAWGYGGAFCVGNLYAWRATDPRELKSVRDPVGPRNNMHLNEMAAAAQVIVLAWGRNGPVRGRADAVCGLDEFRYHWDERVRVLGLTKDGEPRHPLMMPKDSELRAYRV